MDKLFSYDEFQMEKIRREKSWTKDPKYYRNVKITPSALIKMMMHGQQGVDKGTKRNGKPVEVMGLLMGHPDFTDNSCIIITDAQPLPVEGFETRVVVDDVNVENYMIALGESNEIYRKEKFCGWYHTHPFDLDTKSNCFLSNTDISTQLQWQRSEDPHGNPWLAIVIDPIFSQAHNYPALMAFRVYPPDYAPAPNEVPDGTIVTDDRARIERWGVCWNRYYQLQTTFCISSLSLKVFGLLKNKMLWQSSFERADFATEDFTNKILGMLGAGFKTKGKVIGADQAKAQKTATEGTEEAMEASQRSARAASVGNKEVASAVADLMSHCGAYAASEATKKVAFG